MSQSWHNLQVNIENNKKFLTQGLEDIALRRYRVQALLEQAAKVESARQAERKVFEADKKRINQLEKRKNESFSRQYFIPHEMVVQHPKYQAHLAQVRDMEAKLNEEYALYDRQAGENVRLLREMLEQEQEQLRQHEQYIQHLQQQTEKLKQDKLQWEQQQQQVLSTPVPSVMTTPISTTLPQQQQQQPQIINTTTTTTPNALTQPSKPPTTYPAPTTTSSTPTTTLDNCKFSPTDIHHFQTQSFGQDGKLYHFYMHHIVLFNTILLHHTGRIYDPLDVYYGAFNTTHQINLQPFLPKVHSEDVETLSEVQDFVQQLNVFSTYCFQAANTPDFPFLLFNYFFDVSRTPNQQEQLAKVYTQYNNTKTTTSSMRDANLYALLANHTIPLKQINSLYSTLQCTLTLFKTLLTTCQAQNNNNNNTNNPNHIDLTTLKNILLLTNDNPQQGPNAIDNPQYQYYLVNAYDQTLLNPFLFVPLEIRYILLNIFKHVDLPALLQSLSEDVLPIPQANKISKTHTSIQDNVARFCGMWVIPESFGQLIQQHPAYLLYTIIAMYQNLFDAVSDQYLVGMFLASLCKISPIFFYLLLGSSLHTHLHWSNLPTLIGATAAGASGTQNLYTKSPTPHVVQFYQQLLTNNHNNPNLPLINYANVESSCALPCCRLATTNITNSAYKDLAIERASLLTIFFQSTPGRDAAFQLNDNMLQRDLGRIKYNGRREQHPCAKLQQIVHSFNKLHYHITRFSELLSTTLSPLYLIAQRATSHTHAANITSRSFQRMLLLTTTTWSTCTCCGYNALGMPLYRLPPPAGLPPTAVVENKYKFKFDKTLEFTHVAAKDSTQQQILTPLHIYQKQSQQQPQQPTSPNRIATSDLLYTPYPILYTLPTTENMCYDTNKITNFQQCINAAHPQYRMSAKFRHHFLWQFLTLLANATITPMYVVWMWTLLRHGGNQLNVSLKQAGQQFLLHIYNNILLPKRQELLFGTGAQSAANTGKMSPVQLEYDMILLDYNAYINGTEQYGPYQCYPFLEERTIESAQSIVADTQITADDRRLE